jgi:hypothetical protein
VLFGRSEAANVIRGIGSAGKVDAFKIPRLGQLRLVSEPSNPLNRDGKGCAGSGIPNASEEGDPMAQGPARFGELVAWERAGNPDPHHGLAEKEVRVFLTRDEFQDSFKGSQLVVFRRK